jgi:flagellar hook assembly protein FlgD
LSVFSCPFVQIEIYNIRGQRVRTLLDGSKEFVSGQHSVVWNGRDDRDNPVGSGIYFYRMTTNDFQETKKMILIK